MEGEGGEREKVEVGIEGTESQGKRERESLGTRSERAGWERLAFMSSGDVGWLRNGSKENG